MNRFIKSNCSVISDEREFVVELKQNDITLFALEFSMLQMGLVKAINFHFNSGNILTLILGENLKAGEKAIVEQNEKHTSMTLSINQLEYLCAYL